MNLFWKKLFRSLQSTHAIEQQEEETRLAIQRYNDVKESDTLKRYLELKNTVQSPAFQGKKKEYSSGNIRKMKQYAVWERYGQFEKDKKLQLYFKTAESHALKDYLEFKGTPDYRLLANPKEVAKSETLKHFKAFEKSKEFQNYLKFHHSYAVKEYGRLKEVVSTPEFIEEKSFWEDKHRWTKTEEYLLEKEYMELKSLEDVQFYEKNAQLAIKQSSWHLVFEEDFGDGILNTEKWYPGLYQGQKRMEKTYSFANEKQANSGGENIVMMGGELTISTRPDQITTRAWTPAKGFTEKEFHYSSDVINGSNAVKMNKGLISAKVKISGDKDISHAFWLSGKNQTPHINLFYFDGNKIKVGNYWNANGVLGNKSEIISGISPNDYYIYSLEWTPAELIWRVNNVVVLKSNKGIPNEELFPVFNSFISQKQQGGSGELTVDWVKVYKKD